MKIYILGMADRYKIPYVNMCIRLFAMRFQLTLQDAADYLCQFKGIQFIDDYYSPEHLLPIEDTLNDLVAVCKNNGSAIGCFSTMERIAIFLRLIWRKLSHTKI